MLSLALREYGRWSSKAVAADLSHQLDAMMNTRLMFEAKSPELEPTISTKFCLIQFEDDL
jgi:hypothetical protein